MSTPSDSSSRRTFLAAAAAMLGGFAVSPLRAQPAVKAAAQARTTAAPREITIYKDANCGCCKLWVTHLQKAGFATTVHDSTEMSTIKRSLGVPTALESCHTARIGKYTIEGHVPADLITRLLTEQPTWRGLTVPGMPFSAPGMDGTPKQAYDVLLFDAAGKTRVYASR